MPRNHEVTGLTYDDLYTGMAPADAHDHTPREPSRAQPGSLELHYELSRLGMLGMQCQYVASGVAYFLDGGKRGQCNALLLTEVLACMSACDADVFWECVEHLGNCGSTGEAGRKASRSLNCGSTPQVPTLENR